MRWGTPTPLLLKLGCCTGRNTRFRGTRKKNLTKPSEERTAPWGRTRELVSGPCILSGSSCAYTTLMCMHIRKQNPGPLPFFGGASLATSHLHSLCPHECCLWANSCPAPTGREHAPHPSPLYHLVVETFAWEMQDGFESPQAQSTNTGCPLPG